MVSVKLTLPTLGPFKNLYEGMADILYKIWKPVRECSSPAVGLGAGGEWGTS